MSKHLAGSVLVYLLMCAFATFVLAHAIAEYQSINLSRRFILGSFGISAAISGLLAIGAIVDGSVFWALLIAVLLFGLFLELMVSIPVHKTREHEKIRQFWRSHVDAGEDWLYDGKIYHPGEEERELTRERLIRQWPMQMRLIRGALEPLAASPDAQRAIVAKFGSPSDFHELAVELYEVMEFVPLMAEATLITRHQADLVEAVARKLEQMTAEDSDDALWQSDALETSHEWDEVRKLAKGALRALAVDRG